jgi:hypothetical protein
MSCEFPWVQLIEKISFIVYINVNRVFKSGLWEYIYSIINIL